MSDIYIRRLRAVESEFNAARQSISYVERNWHRNAIYREARRITPHDLVQASRNIEATYFIRLYAEFETILKDHLATNHAHLAVSERPKVDWLIGKAAKTEGIKLDPMLRRKMNIVREYRNSIAHSMRVAPAVRLVDALSTLNIFLARLPDPNI